MVRLDENEISFPDPRFMMDMRVIAFGGDLSIDRVWFAYQLGIFPWYNPDEEILWWCPDPRFVLFPKIKISKSMRKILNRNIFTFSEKKTSERLSETVRKLAGKDKPEHGFRMN
jgi:leucyl/phenylalanyl-tRNA--protein transferase